MSMFSLSPLISPQYRPFSASFAPSLRSIVIKMHLLWLLSAAYGLTAAAPRPQNIEFSLAYALPNPSYSEAVGATAQVVTYNPTTVYSAAVAQITSTVSDVSGADAATTDAPVKRQATSCAPQPTGYGPVPSPDSPSAFVSFSSFAAAASAAPTPSGYTLEFENLSGSSNAYGTYISGEPFPLDRQTNTH